MRVVAIIQARMGSSRLPGKALMALRGRPLLSHVIERVQATPGVSEVMLATSLNARDDALLSVAALHGIRHWRGSEWDVLDRLRAAARWARADVVMRVTADCPLFAPDVAGAVLALYQQGRPDAYEYAWNDTAASGWPDGTDVEVFPRALLEVANDQRATRTDREHVTPRVRKLATCVRVLKAPFNLTRLKLSVDKAEDLDRVARVVAELRSGDLSWAATARACVTAGLVEEREIL